MSKRLNIEGQRVELAIWVSGMSLHQALCREFVNIILIVLLYFPVLPSASEAPQNNHMHHIQLWLSNYACAIMEINKVLLVGLSLFSRLVNSVC